jgi:hypothetical protein
MGDEPFALTRIDANGFGSNPFAQEMRCAEMTAESSSATFDSMWIPAFMGLTRFVQHFLACESSRTAVSLNDSFGS